MTTRRAFANALALAPLAHFGRIYAIMRPGTPADLAAFLRSENAKCAKAAAVSGAQVD